MTFDEPDARLPTLYERTGSIADVNTILINRNELRRLYPWWTKLQIRARNLRRLRRFVLHFDRKSNRRASSESKT